MNNEQHVSSMNIIDRHHNVEKKQPKEKSQRLQRGKILKKEKRHMDSLASACHQMLTIGQRMI